jgi:hypothetical protein
VKFTLIKSCKYAKCPIWRRLRTGNAILASISCTQCCAQNRVYSEVNQRPIPDGRHYWELSRVLLGKLAQGKGSRSDTLVP